MALFRRKTPRVVRRQHAEEVARVERKGATIRRFAEPAPEPEPEKKKPKKAAQRSSGNGKAQKAQRQKSQKTGGQQRKRTGERRAGGAKADEGRRRSRPFLEVVPPPDTARKQMLVRAMPHQTQIVVMEGPVLVEHYVARSDKKSLVGNVYTGKVRNVLPGMEAAFVDFGEGKNGVLYASDVNYDDVDLEGKKQRIELAMKPGDSVMVQVVKDAMGHKGARLTNQISLAGRYLVLEPGSGRGGISRRLPDDERRRLREIVADVRPDSKMGIIVRTAAQDATTEDVQDDIDRLLATWAEIESKKDTRAPAMIHEEPPLVIRVIREHFTKDFKRLLIDDPATHDIVTKYLERTEPELLAKVQRYEDELALFERFHVEDQLRKALDRKVWLPSGGHIVIDRTEALTVIDVNTGRFVGHSNLEETVLENNLEAAEEIARQLRLRDIGGIIVIDFIDMEIERNRDAVLLRFREHLAKDKTRTQVFDVSNLGLVEMTRKNVSEGLLESFSDVCPTCSGRGVLLYEEAAASGKPMPKAASE
jgi:ribonuclease E